MEGNVLEQNEEGQNHRQRMERYVEDMSLESSYYRRIKYDLYFSMVILVSFLKHFLKFRTILDLQKNCEDNAENSCIPHIHCPPL